MTFNRGLPEYIITGPKPGDRAILRALNAPITYNGEGWDLELTNGHVIVLPNSIDPNGASLAFLANIMGEAQLLEARQQWREGEDFQENSLAVAERIDNRVESNPLQQLLSAVSQAAVPQGPIEFTGGFPPGEFNGNPPAPARPPEIYDPWLEESSTEKPLADAVGPEPHPDDPHHQDYATWQQQPETPPHEGNTRLQSGPNFKMPQQAESFPPQREATEEELELEELMRREFGDHQRRQRRIRDEYIANAPPAAVEAGPYGTGPYGTGPYGTGPYGAGLSFDPLMVNSLNEDAYEAWLSAASEEQLAQYWRFLQTNKPRS